MLYILDWDAYQQTTTARYLKLPSTWQSQLTYNLDTTSGLIVVDDYDRLLSPFEIKEFMAKNPDYDFAGPEYYRARRKRIWRRSHRRSPRSHTDIRHFKHYRVNPAILETKEAQICGEWGVKMRRKFGSDLWERVEELKPYKKVHHSRHSTGWKNQKLRHQWQVNQK